MAFVTICVMLLLNVFICTSAHSCNYKGYQVMAIRPKSEKDVQIVNTMAVRKPMAAGATWIRPSLPGLPVLHMDKKGSIRHLLEILKRRNISANIIIRDLNSFSGLNDEPNSRLVFRNDMHYSKFNLHEYHDLNEIHALYESLQRSFNDTIFTLSTVGTSFEGRNITVLKISFPSTNASVEKRAIWIECGIHAREWISPASCIFVALTLLGDTRQQLLNKVMRSFNWYIMPVANPDGYVYSWTQDRFWRKTRSLPQQCAPYCDPELRAAERKTIPANMTLCLGCCFGVDPNRNWNITWNGPDVCSSPCCATYPGEAPFSEPETRAISQYILRKQHEIEAFLAVHSYSQLFMYPYAHMKSSPPGVARLRKIAKAVQQAIYSVDRETYHVGSAHDVMYASSGTSMDWIRDRTAIQYSFSVELRPSDRDPHLAGLPAFCLPQREILPTSRELLNALEALASAITSSALTSIVAGKLLLVTSLVVCAELMRITTLH